MKRKNITNLTIDNYIDSCPYCKSNVKEIERQSTLVGFDGEAMSYDDVNHHIFTMECDNGHYYRKHQCKGIIWITSYCESLLILGLVNKFDQLYTYICECGGFINYNKIDKIFICNDCENKSSSI